MQQKHALKGNGIKNSLKHLAFSPSGALLAIMDNSPDHNLAVYNVETGALVAKAKGDRGKCLELAWSSETQFSIIGPKLFKQMTVNNGSIKGRMGNFQKNNNMIGSIAYHGQVALTGCVTGELYSWNGTTLTKSVGKNHSKLIDAITVTS